VIHRVGWLLGLGVVLIVMDSVLASAFGESWELGFPGVHLWTLGAIALVVGVISAVATLLRVR
jgi:hypothetical protein